MRGDNLFMCDACRVVCDRSATNDAGDPGERLVPGEIYTDRECPHCFELAYPVDEKKIPKGAQSLFHVDILTVVRIRIPVVPGKSAGHAVENALTEVEDAFCDNLVVKRVTGMGKTLICQFHEHDIGAITYELDGNGNDDYLERAVTFKNRRPCIPAEEADLVYPPKLDSRD